MTLFDFGNTNFKILKDGYFFSQEISKFDPKNFNETNYFISVNKKISEILTHHKNFINIENFFNLKTQYKGLGIDRISACYDVKNGVVIDAGSAITIDIIENFIHKGGFIMPGISQSLGLYKEISPVLNIYFNSGVELENLPQNTANAVSYGILKPLILTISEISKDKSIIFTGGDGKFLSRFFENSIYMQNLVFRGMQKAIKENL